MIISLIISFRII